MNSTRCDMPARTTELRRPAGGSSRLLAQPLASDRTEPVVEWIIRLCGWSAIVFVFAIFFFVFLLRLSDALRQAELVEFFTSPAWRPTSEPGRSSASWRCWWARWR